MDERLIHIDSDGAVINYTTITKDKAIKMIANASAEAHQNYITYLLSDGNKVVYYLRSKTYLLLEVKKNV